MATNHRGYEIHPGTVNYRNTPRFAAALRRSMANSMTEAFRTSPSLEGGYVGEHATDVRHSEKVRNAIEESIPLDSVQETINSYRRDRDRGYPSIVDTTTMHGAAQYRGRYFPL
jgi:hypothetical protein